VLLSFVHLHNHTREGDQMHVTKGEWESAITNSPDVTGTTLLVALVFASVGGYDRGGLFFQKNGTVAAKAGMSRESVNRHMSKLVEGGWITSTGAKRPGGVKVYWLSIPGLPKTEQEVPKARTKNRADGKSALTSTDVDQEFRTLVASMGTFVEGATAPDSGPA